MGLAASQARLLLLTARKSNLEYRAQMISQRKITLATQTEELAVAYSAGMSNRIYEYDFTQVAGSEVLSLGTLTFDNFTSKDTLTVFRCVVFDEEGNPIEIVKSETDAENKKLKDKNIPYMVLPDVTDTAWFQDQLRYGRILVQEQDSKVKDVWNDIPIDGISNVTDKLNTADDAKILADYTAKSAMLQNQDKKLDLELKQVETQQKAAENEMDSLKKVMEKQFEAFKVFANG